MPLNEGDPVWVDYRDRPIKPPKTNFAQCSRYTRVGRRCPIPADRLDGHGNPVCHVHDPNGQCQKNLAKLRKPPKRHYNARDIRPTRYDWIADTHPAPKSVSQTSPHTPRTGADNSDASHDAQHPARAHNPRSTNESPSIHTNPHAA